MSVFVERKQVMDIDGVKKMKNDILLEGQFPEEIGVLTLQLDRRIEIRFSSREARRIVSRFIHMDVSTQLHASTPILVIGRDGVASWRVPVHLTFPTLGDVGCIGYVHVDPLTGETDKTSDVIEKLQESADALAQRFTLQAA
jgi:hypothetical protein